MSGEIKKTVLNTLAEPISNSAKNLTDKPTQSMGTTLADIWYLVFGGISQAAEKRKLKYAYALEEFEKELQEKIDKIPENNRITADIQVIAPALESSKYCIEKEQLRKMFSSLISKSINIETYKLVHPIFANIIPHITSLDAKLLNNIYKNNDDSPFVVDIEDECLIFSLSALEHQGLIRTNIEDKIATQRFIVGEQAFMPYIRESNSKSKTIHINITELGKAFCKICLEDT